jgi:DNA-binding transcriptional MerR regulator
MRKHAVYFTISQAAGMLGISSSSLRLWEQMGLLAPARSEGRYRLYSHEDLRTARRILYLRKKKGLNLAGVSHLLAESAPAERRKSPPESSNRKTQNIGEQLYGLRRRQGYTLAEVARRTQLSISFLSALERGHANPSIATLQRLAELYKTNVLSMFGAQDKVQRLVRSADRKILRPQPGVQMELLAVGKAQMEPHLFRIAPGATSGGSYHHEGEEFIHVLQGSLEVWLDEVVRYVLAAGDTLYFESTHAHRWKSLSDEETILLWVNTPPTF